MLSSPLPPLMSFYYSWIQFRILIAFSCHVSLVSSNIWWFPHLSLFFMTLTVLKRSGQVLCRMSLHLGLSDVCLMIRLAYGFWVRAPQRWAAFLTTSYKGGHDFSDLTPVMLTLITWLRCCLPGFSIIKLVCLPFHILRKWVIQPSPHLGGGELNSTSLMGYIYIYFLEEDNICCKEDLSLPQYFFIQ